jgi:hypothetical protein
MSNHFLFSSYIYNIYYSITPFFTPFITLLIPCLSLSLSSSLLYTSINRRSSAVFKRESDDIQIFPLFLFIPLSNSVAVLVSSYY